MTTKPTPPKPPPKPPEELSRYQARRILAQMGENGKPPEAGISHVNVGNESYLHLLDDTYIQDLVRGAEGSSFKLVQGTYGSGKTHLLSALAQELVRSGRRVLSRKCGLLVQDLLLAKRDLKLAALLKRLAGYEALIVDDLGYVQQSREEMEVLFTLLAERYERGSVLLTSNLPFSGWEAIFKDPMTTAAAIDRLVHHSVIIELNLPSYRAEQAKKAKQARQADAGESTSGPGKAKP